MRATTALALALIAFSAISLTAVCGLQNWDVDCWSKCGAKDGFCSFCGSGAKCCRHGHTGNGCNGQQGGFGMHRCIEEGQRTIEPVVRDQCNSLENQVNAWRRQNDESTLICDPRIRKFSQKHSYDQTDYLNKYGLRDGKPWDKQLCNGHHWTFKNLDCGRCDDDRCVFEKVTGSFWPYSSSTVERLGLAENSAYRSGGNAAETAMEGLNDAKGWKRSSGHNRNQLDPTHSRIGCASYGKFANCNFI